ncbi:MAG: GyrI-like domain-containing protein [Nanoarchaeota archaeon]
MDHRIEDKGKFKVVGLSIDTSVQNVQKDVPPVWEEFLERYKEIKHYIGGMKNYGVCFEKKKEDCDFQYIACCEVGDFENVPEKMVMAEVDASKYAVFTHKGKIEELSKTYGNIMAFMPSSGMKQKNFWFEFYDQKWNGGKTESEFEIWVAIE